MIQERECGSRTARSAERCILAVERGGEPRCPRPKTQRALALCAAALLGLAVLIGWLAWLGPAPSTHGSVDRPPGHWDARLASAAEPSQGNAPSITETIGQMLAEIDRERALSDLRQLTGEAPICTSAGCYTITHRLTGSEGLDWALDYVYRDLVDLGYTVELLDWSRYGWSDRNLIARKRGVLTPTEEVYFVAHVDGVRNSTQPYPAADDDASCVAGGLELARVFAERLFGRTIVLLFTTGEEQGMLGSRAYLDDLSPGELEAIEHALNCDMIGYDANEDRVMELVHGGHSPSVAVAQVMSATIDALQIDLDPRITEGCP